MKVSDILAGLSRDELQSVLAKSDVRGLLTLGLNCLLILGCFALVYRYPTMLWSWLLASVILGGRQLGLAILMHDCAHGSLFKSPKLNKVFGKWLCAAPVMADLDRYRTYHLEHHRTAGSSEDPDRSNYQGYPVTAGSMVRKLSRDLIGLTGAKIFLLVLKMNAGTVKYQLSYDANKKSAGIPLSQQIANIFRGLYPTLLIHTTLFLCCWLIGRPSHYLLWWLAWMTWYMVFSRIRNAAEHGATIDINDLDPLKNTRTTLANFLERLTVAPNYVNYHLEHHLLATVPPHKLKAFHRLLMKKDVLQHSKIASGYLEVMSDLVATAPRDGDKSHV